MMHRLTISGETKFSPTVTDGVMWYLGNGALTKKWPDAF